MSKIARKLRLTNARNYAVWKLFPICQKLGFHISLNHYYSPIPDTRTLKDDLWLKNCELVGVNMNEKKQLELLSLLMGNYKSEYDSFPRNCTSIPYQYYINNKFFLSVDAEILYSITRYFKPKKLIEIGSGFSTYLSAQAIRENKKEDEGYNCDFKSIDPYPNETIRKGFPGISKVIDKDVQDIPLDEFQKLEGSDILFIDSSHVLKIGSDVAYEYLEILPRLNKGVIVHIHDIFLPAQYPKMGVLRDHMFWNEQYMLQSFLTFNRDFDILWAASYMHLKYPDKLEKAFSSYSRDENWPASFWMQRK